MAILTQDIASKSLSEFRNIESLVEKVILPLFRAEVVEFATGKSNASNVLFNASRDFFPETLRVYLNGLLQVPDNDYNIENTSGIRFTLAPEVNDTITLIYLPSDV